MLNIIEKIKFSQAVRNFNWLVGGSLVRVVVTFLTWSVVARSLGPSDFGVIQYSLSIYMIIQVLENIIHPTVFKKMILDQPEREQNLVNLSALLLAALGLAVVLVIYIIRIFVGGEREWLFLLNIMCIALVLRASNPISYCFDAKLQSSKTVLAQTFGVLSAALLRFFAVFTPVNLLLQAIASVLQQAVSCILHFKFYSDFKLKGLHWQLKLNRAQLGMLLRKSFPLLLSAGAQVIFYRVDQVMLGAMATKKELGVYSIAVKLSEPWFFLAGASINTLFPKVIEGKRKSLAQYHKELDRLFGILFFFAVAIGFTVTVGAPFLIPFLFGEQFSDSVGITQVLIWSNVFLFWYHAQQLWDVQEQKILFNLIKTIFGAGLNIGLNIVLIPKWGAMGCAISSLIAYFFVGSGLNIFIKETRVLLKIQLYSCSYFMRALIKKLS
ncbi:MAG: flippase [Bdellovibrionota bacterium]